MTRASGVLPRHRLPSTDDYSRRESGSAAAASHSPSINRQAGTRDIGDIVLLGQPIEGSRDSGTFRVLPVPQIIIPDDHAGWLDHYQSIRGINVDEALIMIAVHEDQ